MEHGDTVTIFEVGPRDGLQSLPQLIPARSKIALINALSQTGLRKIEATSFVNPKWVPQLADGAEVMSGISRKSGVNYSALAPNLRGAQNAIDAGCDEIAVFISASEGFSQANLNCSIEDSIANIGPAIKFGHEHNVPVRGYLSCIIECPFDGPVKPTSAAELSKRLLELGCYEVSLGDTLGSGTPDAIKRLLDAVLQTALPSQIAGHFHDTHRLALPNIECSLDYGIRTFDSSIAGLGGCPYAPGASGNVDTCAVLELLNQLGFTINVEMENIKAAETIALKILQEAQPVKTV